MLTLIDEGLDLRQIEKIPGMPSRSSISAWLTRNEGGLARRYSAARERRADRLAREIMDIADAVNTSDPAAVNAARLQCDVRKWYLAKTMPEKYGDTSQVTISAKPAAALALAGAAAIAEAQRLKSLLEAPPAEAIEVDAREIEATNNECPENKG